MVSTTVSTSKSSIIFRTISSHISPVSSSSPDCKPTCGDSEVDSGLQAVAAVAIVIIPGICIVGIFLIYLKIRKIRKHRKRGKVQIVSLLEAPDRQNSGQVYIE